MMKLQFRVLYREFLFRMIDLELLAPQGDIRKLLGQFAALLVVFSFWVLLPAVIMTGSTSSEVGLLFAWATEHFIIATTMLVVGLFSVLSWESMFPDRRDVMVLSPLPVRARTLFLAKVAAVATALSITVLCLNFLPGVAAPFAFSAAPTLPPPKYDRALAPVHVTGLQAVLDRDMTEAREPGSGKLALGNERRDCDWCGGAWRAPRVHVWNRYARFDLRDRFRDEDVYGTAAGADGSAKKGQLG